MKRFFILFTFLLIALLSKAETLEFNLNAEDFKQSTLTICGINYRCENVLPFNPEQIDTIAFSYDKPIQSCRHKLVIGGIPVKVYSTNIISEYSFGKKIVLGLVNAITLQPGDVISVQKEKQKCDFKVRVLSDEEVRNNCKISFSNGKDTLFVANDCKADTINLPLQKSDDIQIKDVIVKCNNIDIEAKLTDNVVKCPIAFNDTIPTYNIVAYVKVSGNNNHDGVALTECVIQKSSSVISVTQYLVWGCIIVLTILLLSYLLFIRGWHKVKCDDDKSFKVKGNINKICIGNKAIPKGQYSYSGSRYIVSRISFHLFPVIESIWNRIQCKDNQCFEVKSVNSGQDKAVMDWKSGDSYFQIYVDAEVDKDGTFEIANDFDDFIVVCKDNKVRSIQKKIISKTDNKEFLITLRSSGVEVGDSVAPVNPTGSENNSFCIVEATDGNTYEIRSKQVSGIKETNKSRDEIEALTDDQIKSAYEKAREEITSQYQNIIKNDYISISDHSTKIEELSKQIQELQGQNNALAGQINSACEIAREEERKLITTQYRRKIDNEYISISLHSKEKEKLTQQLDKAKVDKENAEHLVKSKESLLNAAKIDYDNLKEESRKQEKEIIGLNARCSELKTVAEKKNMHYLLKIQETLSEISDDFKDVYNNINNNAIKDGLINPVIKGVSGFSTGILLWNEDFIVNVWGNKGAFFGQEFFTMAEDDVKEQIAKKFISTIVKSDSFSKFIRLYQLSSVPFIRKQMIEAKINIQVLNRLYYKVYSLVTDFGYNIICPMLFEEQYSESKYQWFHTTNLFDIVSLSEDEKARIKAVGKDTIIDVIQIGYESPWINRKATAVTADFIN